MEFKNEINTYLALRDKYDSVQPFQLAIYAKSGHGKGLASEFIAEEMHNAGYIVLVIADPKEEWEWAYAMFKPESHYHLAELNRQGLYPDKKKVKIYHPFTFNIPTTLLPEVNFYTFSFKDMGREEWSMISESMWESEPIRLLLQASNQITKEDGLYGFIHTMSEIVTGKFEGKKIVRNAKNFYLPVSGGIAKSSREIAGYLQPFKQNYFLAKESCPLKLDWEKIYNDQESYHVFTSSFLDDDKLKEFVVLTLLQQAIRNRRYSKHPVLIIIPEIRKLTPNLTGAKKIGYKVFLANGIKNSLSTMRSMGRGFSSIIDSQSFSDTDEDVRNSATITFFGEVAPKDSEQITKTKQYKRETRQLLSNMGRKNCFLVDGKEDYESVTIFFPSHMHKEPQYNFFEMYKKHYPEKMIRYTEMINMMKIIYKQEEEKIRDRVKREEREQKEIEERKRNKKIEKEQEAEDIETEKKKKIENDDKLKLMKLCYEEKKENPEMSFRQIGNKFSLNHITVKKYIEIYEKTLLDNSENKIEPSG